MTTHATDSPRFDDDDRHPPAGVCGDDRGEGTEHQPPQVAPLAPVAPGPGDLDIVTTGPLTHTRRLVDYSAALSAFQGSVEGAKKGRENPHFRSRYARLEDAWRAARDALAAHGLAVQQTPVYEAGLVSVATTILHASGQWTQSTLSLPVQRNDAQGIGSAITYACRYTFMAALGLPPEDDDDGNAAVASKADEVRSNGHRDTKPSKPAGKKRGKKAKPAKLSPAAEQLAAAIAPVTCGAWWRVVSAQVQHAELTDSDRSQLVERLTAKQRELTKDGKWSDESIALGTAIAGAPTMADLEDLSAAAKDHDDERERKALQAYIAHRTLELDDLPEGFGSTNSEEG